MGIEKKHKNVVYFQYCIFNHQFSNFNVKMILKTFDWNYSDSIAISNSIFNVIIIFSHILSLRVCLNIIWNRSFPKSNFDFEVIIVSIYFDSRFPWEYGNPLSQSKMEIQVDCRLHAPLVCSWKGLFENNCTYVWNQCFTKTKNRITHHLLYESTASHLEQE